MKKLAIAFFLTFTVLPLAAGVVYATLYSLGLVGALATGFSLSAWEEIITDGSFWLSIGLSAGLAVVVVLISTALAMLLLTTMRNTLNRPSYRFLLHFPLAVPPLVAAFVSFQWLGSSGLLARAAHAASWIAQPDQFPELINDPLYMGVGITMVLSTLPFFLLVFLNHYQSENLVQFAQLAATLGASPAQINRRIIVPAILRRAAPTLVLFGVFLFGAYEVPLLLGRQNPAMISMFIHQKFNRYNLQDLPEAYAATLVYALLVVLLALVFLRRTRKVSDRLSA